MVNNLLNYFSYLSARRSSTSKEEHHRFALMHLYIIKHITSIFLRSIIQTGCEHNVALDELRGRFHLARQGGVAYNARCISEVATSLVQSDNCADNRAFRGIGQRAN